MVQWLRLHAPNAGGLCLSPSQGTRSHVLHLKNLWATTKTQHSQINKINKLKKKRKAIIVPFQRANVTWFFKQSNFIYLFIFDCVGSSLLHELFSSCGEQGLNSSFGAQAFHCSVCSCCRAQALGLVGSVAAPGIYSTGSIAMAHVLIWFVACGIFLDQGSYLRLLHWQTDSLPLGHQGSLWLYFDHVNLLEYF